MRGMVDGLVNPQPLADSLPATYLADDGTRPADDVTHPLHGTSDADKTFIERFLGGLDAVSAPVIATLDSVPAYLDPSLTPPDFLPWLASWVGLELNENWSDTLQRQLIGRVVSLHSWRGTVRGLEDLLRLFLGLDADAIEIVESGGTVWSAVPGAQAPGGDDPSILVRVRAGTDTDIDDDALQRLVGAMTPAHVVHRAEVVRE